MESSNNSVNTPASKSRLLAESAPHFFIGKTLRELATLIGELDCGLRTKVAEKESHREIISFIEHEVARKQLVICSWRAVRESHSHAVLVVGVESTQHIRRFDCHALLILDPAEPPPDSMATCNARLHYAGGEPTARPRYISYTIPKATFPVVLGGAMSIDMARAKKPP
jgi:hypothetical protein